MFCALLSGCQGDTDAGSGATAVQPSDGSTGDGSGGSTDATEGTGGGTAATSGEPTTGAGESESESGTTDDPGPGVIWAFDPVFGRANLDDDDDSGKPDWVEPFFDGDNELTELVLPGEILDALPPGAKLRLSLAGPGDLLRAWIGDQVVLGSNPGDPIREHTMTPPGGDVRLLFEFGEHNVRDELTIAWLDDQGAEVESFVVTVRSSPLIINHHLQPTEEVWVVEVSGGGGYNNKAMVQALQAVLGDRLHKVPGPAYQWDVWIQDEFEWALARSADGGRLDVVIDSIRDRGLDPLPEDTLVGPDYIAQTWGSPANKTTYDSFGNLDASPPVTVGGTFYPFGRAYYGKRGNEGLDDVLESYLHDQAIQAPFALDTTWLCVGHIDEISGIMPDPDAPKGFRLLFSDVPAMYELLDSLPGDMQIPRYGQDYGYATIAQLRGDPGLRALNEDIQADHLDGILEVFKTELGLDDGDIIKIPTLFEKISCGMLALIPGTVNFALINVEGEPVRAFIPDPFLRSGPDQNSDPVIADFRARAPKSVELHFVDNWNVYHLNRGEVHCGTNMQRAPIADWWAY